MIDPTPITGGGFSMTGAGDVISEAAFGLPHLLTSQFGMRKSFFRPSLFRGDPP
jgi:hypothetical protein